MTEQGAVPRPELTRLWLLHHGETEWSRSGRYTGLTDLPLTEHGEEQARSARRALAGVHFDLVLSSPALRARQTAELAGFPEPVIDPAAHEWDYGDYEGINSADIRKQSPGYLIWDDGVPGGETLEQVSDRADAVLARIFASAQGAEAKERRVLLVAHGHFLRILTARWLGLPPNEGRHFVLGTAKSVS